MSDDYYVYVYIDPRNLEEFYYGKGKGSRKEAHLPDVPHSDKSGRISKIKEEGLEPTVRVIASNLTEQEALLIETTLIWKLGRLTDNVAQGHFVSKFRPPDTYHAELPGFDFQNGIYFYNVGENIERNWDDYVEYGFISAGQGEPYRKAMREFKKGDVALAYLVGHGYVGVGKIIEPAKRIRDVEIDGKRLLDHDLKCKNMGVNSDDPVKSEYVALVEWIKTVPREKAKWRRRSKLYSGRGQIRASLAKQSSTIDFVSQEFGVDVRSLADGGAATG